MTEKTTETTTSTPATSAPLPGEGTGGCLGLIVGVAFLLAVSIACTVIGYLVVHAFHWA